MSHVLNLLILLLRVRLDRVRDERGASAVEWVVITAFLVLIAGALYAVLSGKIANKANSINL